MTNKQAKRSAYQRINNTIISAAESGNVDALLESVCQRLPEMNLVNLSTALHRLAKMASNDSKAHLRMLQHQVLTDLVRAVAQALDRAAVSDAPPRCQALSNITWALATVQLPDLVLLQALSTLSLRNIDGFKPFELSSSLWAFAKLGTLNQAVLECSAPLFLAASTYIPPRIREFTFRCAVMLAWAFATARHFNEVLFTAIAETMVSSVRTASCQELANTAWSFSCVGFKHGAVFSEVAKNAVRRMSEFKAQDLSTILCSYATLGIFQEELFVSAAHLAPFLDLEAPHLAQFMWAFTRLQPQSTPMSHAVLALLPRCTQHLANFKPQEFASVAQAAAKCFGQGASGEVAQDIWAVPPGSPPVFPPPVVAFCASGLPFTLAHLKDFTGQSLANVASAFQAIWVGDLTALYQAIAHESTLRIQDLESSALVLLLRTLIGVPRGTPQIDIAVRTLFAECAERCDKMQGKDLRILRVCVGQGGRGNSVLPRDELRRCCQEFAKHGIQRPPRPHGQFAQAPGQWPATRASLQGPVDMSNGTNDRLALQKWRTLEEDNLQHFLDAAAGNGDPSAAGGGGDKSLPRFSYSVKNTFIDIEGAAESEDGSEEEGPTRLLPPPLDIIPAGISPEKLEAYRIDYQNFRAGKSVGAKGEINAVAANVAALDLATTSSPSRRDTEEATSGAGLGSQDASTGMTLPVAQRPSAIRFEAPERRASGPTMATLGGDPCKLSAEACGALTFSIVGYDDDAPGVQMSLPPPLDLLPRHISVEQLASFRMDYQKFRAGGARGARGELPKVVAVPPLTEDGDGESWPSAVLHNSAGSLVTPIRKDSDLTQPPDGRALSRSRCSTRASHASTSQGHDEAGGASSSTTPAVNAAAAGASTEAPSASSGSSGQATTKWSNVEVKNTFLHIDDRTARMDAGEEEEEAEPSVALPPALDIIPAEVSEERLAAYRNDYQRFRTGKAIGARGELSDSVFVHKEV